MEQPERLQMEKMLLDKQAVVREEHIQIQGLMVQLAVQAEVLHLQPLMEEEVREVGPHLLQIERVVLEDPDF